MYIFSMTFGDSNINIDYQEASESMVLTLLTVISQTMTVDIIRHH